MRLTAAIRKEGTWYVAQCIEVDVASQGTSVEHAVANLQEALELYFEDAGSVEIPNGPTIVATVEIAAPSS